MRADALTAIEIRGLYDGVAVWVYADGRLENRFAGWNTPLEQRIDAWIAEHGDAVRAQYGLEKPSA